MSRKKATAAVKPPSARDGTSRATSRSSPFSLCRARSRAGLGVGAGIELRPPPIEVFRDAQVPFVSGHDGVEKLLCAPGFRFGDPDHRFTIRHNLQQEVEVEL